MSPRDLRRPSVFLLVVALVPLLALAERAVHSAFTHFLYPTRQAEWIWAPMPAVEGRPLAFYAALDFELVEVPRVARLLASADERMVVLLNGRTVAADAYVPGAPIGAWEVTAELRPGRNRLVAALASTRGVGAFLASLELEERAGVRRLVTNEEWRIFWRFRRALLRPGRALDEGARPHVWGVPPVGRWPGGLATRERPVFHRLVGAPPVPPQSAHAWGPGGWRPVGWADRARGEPWGGQLLLDWGREVTGYLSLRYRSDDPPPAAIYFGLGIPDPVRRAPGAVVVTPAGGRYWHDAAARTFRYALVVGGAAPRRAELLPVAPGASDGLVAGRSPRGVFGLQPPRLRTPIENEIWSEVEGLEGAGGGELR